jgi:hypothetical protein
MWQTITNWKMDQAQKLDSAKLDKGDKAYVYNLYNGLLDHYKPPKGTPMYYYQYEIDWNHTPYERLMSFHAIAIEAQSLEEANIINAILRCLLDGHTYSLINYAYDKTKVNAPGRNELVQTVSALLQNIKNSNTLTICASPKELANGVTFRGFAIEKPIVFDLRIVRELVSNSARNVVAVPAELDLLRAHGHAVPEILTFARTRMNDLQNYNVIEQSWLGGVGGVFQKLPRELIGYIKTFM